MEFILNRDFGRLLIFRFDELSLGHLVSGVGKLCLMQGKEAFEVWVLG